jgi:adenosylcobinamide-phosphate synthase
MGSRGATRHTLAVRALAILVAMGADAVFGDPRRWHPVAGYGRVAGAVERRMWADTRMAGAGFVAIAVGAPVVLSGVLAHGLRRHALLRVAVLGAATWATLGGTSLSREGDAMARLLESGDLPGARDQLSHLCARDPEGLPVTELTRATVESLAENTSDAVVAPLVWAAIVGLPGVVGYRALNTLDAMVGYRSARYARFGWAAARLDDGANLLPSRFSAVLSAVAAPVIGGSPSLAWQMWRRDGSHHPSPNAGQCEAAFAGALGVTLGGRNVYDGDVQDRGTLGSGPAPALGDIGRSARLSRAVGALAALTLSSALAVRAATKTTRTTTTSRGRRR